MGHLNNINLPIATSQTIIRENLPRANLSNLQSRSLQDWHLALNHLNNADILKLRTRVHGFDLSDTTTCDCITCITGKSKLNLFPISQRVLTRPGELISGDWWGPTSSPTINGHKYFSHLSTISPQNHGCFYSATKLKSKD